MISLRRPVSSALASAVVAAALAAGGWQIYLQYEATRPCATPMRYAIGAIDPRFGISRESVIADAKIAAEIWNRAAHKELLRYDPSASLQVSLVYDEREELALLGARITREQESQALEREHIDVLQASVDAQQRAYNAKVAAVNARGGATKDEKVALDAERAALESAAVSLNRRVDVYNQAIATLNRIVEQYNQNAGHTFEEGQYVRDAAGERITIFEFIGETQLERVLAHEFGHAIGLDHNEDPNAIMYAKNESGNLKPSPADLDALTALCNLSK